MIIFDVVTHSFILLDLFKAWPIIFSMHLVDFHLTIIFYKILFFCYIMYLKNYFLGLCHIWNHTKLMREKQRCCEKWKLQNDLSFFPFFSIFLSFLFFFCITILSNVPLILSIDLLWIPKYLRVNHINHIIGNDNFLWN